MKTYNVLSILFFIIHGLFFSSCQNSYAENLSSQKIISLNGIWDFKYIPSVEIGNDSLFYKKNMNSDGWSKIQVPGNWELQGFALPSYSDVEEGTGLYRRTFELPQEYRGEQIFIQFEGVLYGYEVFVNEKYVGHWASSFNANSFNITQYVNFSQKNLLAVRVSTRPKGYQFDLSDCWGLSGIFREVKLFNTPDIYICDYTVKSFVYSDKTSSVDVSIDIDGVNPLLSDLQIKGELTSSLGEKLSVIKKVNRLLDNELSFVIKSPKLWTAETPNLYNLKLLLIKNGQVIQEKNQPVGIREITIDKAVLKLNGSPLKLRGVNHHDLVPETGRSMRIEDIRKDLCLIKDANINYIRTSHYPPDYRLLDLCDSLGLYVSCEVPFNFGTDLLIDTTYQDILLARAKSTLQRDKNHPSIILWTIGNENRLTPIVEKTGKYVQNVDPSRPICFPQTGSYFRANYESFPNFLDIYTPHYCGDDWIRDFAKKTTKPVLLTEYSHSRGLTFGDLETTWKELFRNEQFIGGGIWHFQDQGILRKAVQPVDKYQPTYSVWEDSLCYFDSESSNGTDGIVYADRTPQVDYWEVRKVYSPIQIIDEVLPIEKGEQRVTFLVYNQYDFLNLSTLNGKWNLYKNRDIIQTGDMRINCAPHDTVVHEITINVPDLHDSSIWYLKCMFSDESEKNIYEHTIQLLSSNTPTIENDVVNELAKTSLHVNNRISDTRIDKGDDIYIFSKEDLSMSVSSKSDSLSMIEKGNYARVGRGLVINDLRAKDRTQLTSWSPHLIPVNKIKNQKESYNNGCYMLSADVSYVRGEDYIGECLEGTIAYSLDEGGVLTVNYSLRPKNVTGIIMESGISFILPERITDFIWLGKGPYSSYSGKEMLNDFGIYYLKKGDLYFHGNRSNVQVAIFSDSAGNGLAIMGENLNIAVEEKNNKIIMSPLGFVTGKNSKIPANDIEIIKADFKLIILHAGHWPKTILEILGNIDPQKKPFQPFYHSYEQTK